MRRTSRVLNLRRGGARAARLRIGHEEEGEQQLASRMYWGK